MLRIFKKRNAYPLIGTVLSITIIYPYSFADLIAQIGLLLTLLGLGIWWIAHLTLGDSFALLPQAKRLVAKGIYKKLRHPIYVGLSLTAIGLAIVSSSPILMGIAIVAVISSVWRAFAEEKVLLQKFGDSYSEYKRQTWF